VEYSDAATLRQIVLHGDGFLGVAPSVSGGSLSTQSLLEFSATSLSMNVCGGRVRPSGVLVRFVLTPQYDQPGVEFVEWS
jgi:hypothetical protein